MTCPACAALRAEVERLTNELADVRDASFEILAEVKRLTESAMTTGNLNLQLAREVDTADADAERLAAALRMLDNAIEVRMIAEGTNASTDDLMDADHDVSAAQDDAREALRQHEART